MKKVRRLNELKSVLYDRKWAEKAPDFDVYNMYRGVKKKGELRYDITVILPEMLGEEFAKTKGHEHLERFCELYVVLEGKAIFLVQKCKNKKVEDVYATKAKKGEAFIVPPHYGHATINPSKKEKLKVANWLSEKSQHVYDLIDKKQGLCYYYTKKGWIKNRNYKNVPKLYFKKPLKSIPKDLSFLKG